MQKLDVSNSWSFRGYFAKCFGKQEEIMDQLFGL